jgi:hypothetical protein
MCIYRYPISWEAFLDPSDSYFLFADFVDFLYTLNIYAVYPPPPSGSGGIIDPVTLTFDLENQ